MFGISCSGYRWFRGSWGGVAFRLAGLALHSPASLSGPASGPPSRTTSPARDLGHVDRLAHVFCGSDRGVEGFRGGGHATGDRGAGRPRRPGAVCAIAAAGRPNVAAIAAVKASFVPLLEASHTKGNRCRRYLPRAWYDALRPSQPRDYFLGSSRGRSGPLSVVPVDRYALGKGHSSCDDCEPCRRLRRAQLHRSD